MSNDKKVSIIIPCFNCEATLEEAVDSCFKQGLDNFEIILVDDCSNDSTPEIIKTLKERHSQIKAFTHTTRSGGGATRNTAIKNSIGELIFCLDSDDMLGEDTLVKMANFIKEKNCNGVIYSTAIKFKGKDINDVAVREDFSQFKSKIPLESFFQDETICPLYTVFMFTRGAFEIVGGYPTNHGFDTQGFGLKFLMNNLSVYVCPDTTYFHRVSFGKSYYIREYEDGKINHDFYLMLQEFLYIFDQKIQEKILKYDLNKLDSSLFNEIKRSNKILRDDWSKFVVENTKENYKKISDANNAFDVYWLALYKFEQGDFLEAQKLFEKVIPAIPENRYSHYYLKKCVANTKIPSPFLDENKITELLDYKKYGSKISTLERILRKIKKCCSKK